MNLRRTLEAGFVIAASAFATIGSTYGLSKNVFAKEPQVISSAGKQNSTAEIVLSNGQRVEIFYNTPTPTKTIPSRPITENGVLVINHVTPTPEPTPELNTEMVNFISSEESVQAPKKPTPTKIPTPHSNSNFWIKYSPACY